MEHSIFSEPNDLRLSLEQLPPPKEYRLPGPHTVHDATMAMWRVQIEGYRDARGFPPGCITPFLGFEDSPDCEIIASGQNTKGPHSVALARQANFFHWGFSASPAHMTSEAKLVFINALHYIIRFSGQQALVRPRGRYPLLRSRIDQLLYRLSEKGFTAIVEHHEERERSRVAELARIQEKKASGGSLSSHEKALLRTDGPQASPPSREQFVKFTVPVELRSKLKDNWRAYASCYSDNYDYLYPAPDGDGRLSLTVDEDVRVLGIPNHKVALLERCVTLLEDEEHRELAHRVLKRYCGNEPQEGWRNWVETNRAHLFFTEVGGFKFLLNSNSLR